MTKTLKEAEYSKVLLKKRVLKSLTFGSAEEPEAQCKHFAFLDPYTVVIEDCLIIQIQI